MGLYNIDNTVISNAKNVVKDYEFAAKTIDGPTGGKETSYMNNLWPTYWGIFNSNPDLKSALLMKATWVIGKGWTADTRTTSYLNNIKGWGKDSFDEIMFNLVVQSRVNGDAFAEFIKDDQNPILNLKPLDPGSMKIIVNEKGIIIRYEQVNRIENKEVVKTFQPDEIFHLCHNRIGNQIHGISDLLGMEEVLKAENESFGDNKKLIRRLARPLLMFKLKTDNISQIDKIVSKIDEALNKGENGIYIPDDENIISYEEIKVNPSNLIMEWRNDIRNKFYRTIGLPQVVPGAGGQSTESESKVIYFAFEQIVKKEQRFLENQIRAQLNLDVKFNPPTSLLDDMATDQAKDAGGIGVQLNAANKEEV